MNLPAMATKGHNIIRRLVPRCIARAAICLVMTSVAAMPEVALPQTLRATNFDVVKLPVRQDVPINLDPRNGVTQGIFRPSQTITMISMNSDGWIGPQGAGIFLGDQKKAVPNGWCNILVAPATAQKPPVAMNLECTLEGLWYSAIRQDDMHVITTDGKPVDFSLAYLVDGGVRTLKIKSAAMREPVSWTPRKFDTGSKTLDIPGIGNLAVFARPQIPSDQLVILLTATQAEALGKRLTVADRAELAKIVGR